MAMNVKMMHPGLRSQELSELGVRWTGAASICKILDF